MAVSSHVVAGRLTCAENPTGVQVLAWTTASDTAVFYRLTPKGTRNPSWKRAEVPSEWATDPTFVASFLSNTLAAAMPTSTGITVHGYYAVPMDEAWADAITDGAMLPKDLAHAVTTALGSPAPYTWDFSSHEEVALDYVSGVLQALRDGDDLSEWTEGLLSAVTVAAGAGLVASKGIDPNDGIHLPTKNETYMLRESGIVNGWWDAEVQADAFARGWALLYLGIPGTGKTALALAGSQLAFGHDEIVEIKCDFGTTPQDLQGDFLPTATPGVFEWRDGPLLYAMKKGLPCLVDEVMRLDPRVAPIFYGLLDGRRSTEVKHNPAIGNVVAAEGFCLVFTSNPKVDGASMDEPLFSRLIPVEMTTDWDLVRRTIGSKSKVHEKVIGAMENLDTRRRNDEMLWSPQHREAAQFAALAEVWGAQSAISAIITKAREMGTEADQDLVVEALELSLGQSNLRPLTSGVSLV